MVVATAQVTLRLYNAYSLKEKRHIIKSVIEKSRKKYNVSIAEVKHQEVWNMACIGFACVSEQLKQAEMQLQAIIMFLEENYEYEIINIEKQIY